MERELIEEEIRHRQEKWRRGPGPDKPEPPKGNGGPDEPPPPTRWTDDNSEDTPHRLVLLHVDTDEKLRPSHDFPDKIQDDKQPETSEVLQQSMETNENRDEEASQDNNVFDFSAYVSNRRKQERPTQKPQENAEEPIYKLTKPRPPDIPIPRYEPLDYSSGPVTVQDFSDRLAPIVRAASFRYELLDSEVGDNLVVYSALTLQDRMMGSRVLQRILKRNCSLPYEEVGLLAVMVGETGIAEHLIQDLEKKSGIYYELKAGTIAAKLPDRGEAYRLLRKFEEKGNQAAALLVAVEIGDGEAIKRLLVDIIQYGIIDAERGYFGYMTESLLKAVPAYPALGKRILNLIHELRRVANVFAQKDRKVPDLDYVRSAGKIAAVLGEVNDASRSVDTILYEADFVSVAEIATLMEEERLTEQAVGKYIEVTGDKVNTSKLGYIIGTTANHHLPTAEKMWMLFEEKFPEDSPLMARAIIRQLVPSSPLRQEHNAPKAASTDPWTELTQNVGELTKSFEKLTEATEEGIRKMSD